MSYVENQAFRPALTWAIVREQLCRSARSSEWREAGLWALDTLERKLGPEWPALTIAKNPGGDAGFLALAASHVVAFAQTLELALGLVVLDKAPGIARVRRAIATDPRADHLAHARLQLEVAGLAARCARALVLEPKLGRIAPADVAFTYGSADFVVEARAVLTSDAWRDQSRRTDQLFDRIHDLESQHAVRCDGDLARQLNDDETHHLLGLVEDRARLIAMGVVAPPVRFAGAYITVARRDDRTGGGLTGPEARGNSWDRIGPRIAEKAARARASGANWLRLDASDGLWQFTHWALKPLAAKLHEILPLVEPALAGLDGIVMSSGALLRQGEFRDEDVILGDIHGATRRLLPGLRVRETLVIGTSADRTPQAQFWRALYADEPGWLDFALDQVGLPPCERIFAV